MELFSKIFQKRYIELTILKVVLIRGGVYRPTMYKNVQKRHECLKKFAKKLKKKSKNLQKKRIGCTYICKLIDDMFQSFVNVSSLWCVFGDVQIVNDTIGGGETFVVVGFCRTKRNFGFDRVSKSNNGDIDLNVFF